MKLVPWTPFGDLSTLGRETGNSWSRSFDETPSTNLVLGQWVPWIDISETKENVVVKAELPGLEAKDLSVSIWGDVLTIKGEKKKEEKEEDEHCYYCERYCGSFYRSFRLPVSVRSDEVKETLKNGVLKVTLSKAAEPKEEGCQDNGNMGLTQRLILVSSK
jgi:HSP20 family protein